MNKQLSDQELTQMVQSITNQYASSPPFNFTIKRLLTGLGFLIVFIFFTLLLIKQFTFSSHRPKNTLHSQQIIPFEEPHPIEPISEAPTPPPPVVPTTNPVQIPVPPQPTYSSLPHMLPLPIPDNQTEIRPLIPPIPFPPPSPEVNNSNIMKPNPEPKQETTLDPLSPLPNNKELDKVEEPESVIDIQLSKTDDNV